MYKISLLKKKIFNNVSMINRQIFLAEMRYNLVESAIIKKRK